MTDKMAPYPDLDRLMAAALVQAKQAAAAGEVPVGAVLAGPDGAILAAAHNTVEATRNPLRHAEMLVLEAVLAGRDDKFLSDCTLAVTLEPCPMCMGALGHARVGRVVFGAYDPKSGGAVNGPRVASHLHAPMEVLGGIQEETCTALLRAFFKGLR